jgi:membrane AbrB-like protein
VGLNLTYEILIHLVAWLPLMIASAVASVIASAFVSVLLGILAKIDTQSAYFASLPGGLAEMSDIGAKLGANPEPIAVVQTVRVALLVLAVPPILFQFGVSTDQIGQNFPDLPLLWVPPLVAGGAALAYILGRAHLNNPWMLGATIFAATLTASGIVSGHMPQPIFLAAQFLIGVAVGCRFRPFMIRRLPRVTFFGTLTVALLGMSMVAFSFLVALISSIDVTTAILATSPGGMSEMAATAQVLNLSVATVVAFQIVRALVVNGFAVHFWNLLSWFGLFTTLQKLFGRDQSGSRPD